MMSSVKQTASAQQVIDRLAERCGKASGLPANCTLGPKSRRRHGGACSACTHPQEFEIDRAIGQFIDNATFKRAGVCPYQVVTSYLAAGLIFGPEAFRARSAGRNRVDPMIEVKEALRRIGSVIRATGLTREDIEAIAISNDGDWWQALNAVLSAERALGNALAMFRSQVPVATGRSPRGRTGALHIQAVTRALAGAWRELTGRLPAKDNSKFHGLLDAAVGSIFGHPAKEPDWESATKTAVERIKKDEASRG
jgi:hypothetical protein